MNYSTYHILTTDGMRVDVMAVSIDAAKTDLAEAFYGAEVLTYSVSE